MRIPWILLPIWVLANGLLAFTLWPLGVKVAAGLFGLVLPWIWAALRAKPIVPRSNPPTQEFLPEPAGWVLGAVLAAAVFIRFYRLDSLFAWPNPDEGLNGMLAIDLGEKWSWQFFYTYAQLPPVFLWGLQPLFAHIKNPFLDLWLLPALLSTLTLPLGFLALRAYFPRPFSLLVASLVAFGLWPFYCGRWCHNGALIPPWECLCFFLMARFLRTPREAGVRREAFLLGLALGLGAYLFTSWVFIVGAVLIAVGWKGWNERRQGLGWVLAGGAGFLLALAPFLVAVLREGYGTHIGSTSAFSGWFSWGRQLSVILAYGADLLWGSGAGDPIYTADRGGWFNPLLGACVLLGAVQLFRHRFQPWAGWLMGALILTWVPGLVSMNVEMFRVIQVMPLLFVVAGLGLECFLAAFPRELRLWLWGLVLLVSVVWDGWQVTQTRAIGRFPSAAILQGVLPEWRDYQVLRAVEEAWGPGWVFTEFTPSSDEQTPFATAYHFNSAENPGLPVESAKWAAVITGDDYEPFLRPRFADAQWYLLTPGSDRGLVGIIPLTPANRKVLGNWRDAHHYFRALTRDIQSIQSNRDRSLVEADFQNPPPILATDRFLESCYWERRADFYYEHGFETHYGDMVHALQEALRRGYPREDLYYRLGCLWWRGGHAGLGRENLEQALRLAPGDTRVRQALDMERALETPKRGSSAP